MFRRRFLWRALALLIVVGLLVAGGFVLHRAGFTQGYAVGRLAGLSDEGALPAPYAAYPPYGYGGGFLPFACVGLFFPLALILLLFFVAGPMFRFWAWRPGGQRKGWSRRWHGWEGPPADGSETDPQAAGRDPKVTRV